MITEEQLRRAEVPIPFIPVKRLKRDDILYVMAEDIPHPIYGYAKYHKEYSVIDLRGYRRGYEPRLTIRGIYTPDPKDTFRLQTGKLPPYQPTTTGDKLLTEMRRIEVHKAYRIAPVLDEQEKDLYWWTIDELRRICRKEGISDRGNKDDLIQRLKKVRQ